MKTIKKYIAVALLTLATTSFGQQVQPFIGEIEHNDGTRTCLTVDLDPSAEKIEESWEGFMKDNYGVKLSGTGIFGTGNLFAEEEIVIPTISEKRMDFYTKIETIEDKSRMTVFAAFGADVYINPTDYPAEYNALKKMIEKYLSDYLPRYYNDQIETAQKKLKTLNKQGEKLAKKQAKMEKKINKLESEIEENSAAQETNSSAQKSTSELLNKRKKSLESVLKKLGQM